MIRAILAGVEIVLLLFRGITALDVVGPYEVLWRLPGAKVRFVAEEAGPMSTDEGALALVATAPYREVTRADLLVVPGGLGTRRLERAAPLLEWLRAIHPTTRFTTSVCTGALLLAAAGLLRGARATTHWGSLPRLAEYGAIPVEERVVEAGKLITAAGVSAGIDMALTLAARIAGPEVAQEIQLRIEYAPAPPFSAGTPREAPPEVVAAARARMRSREG